jgi:uncharacterized protein YcfJ
MGLIRQPKSHYQRGIRGVHTGGPHGCSPSTVPSGGSTAQRPDQPQLYRYPMSLLRVLFPLLAVSLIAWTPQNAGAQVQTQRGATMGGLAGAVVGGLIGDKNNEAGAGAAIGGVVGAVTGGLLGNAADKQQAIDRQRYYYNQQQIQQQQIAATQAAVSLTDVVTMTRSGLSEAVIINQVQQRGIQQKLQVPDIISLHQQGVSENVITAMQSATTGMQQVARARAPVIRHERVVTPAPVIVEQHYIRPYYPPPRYHHHHHHGFHYRF